MEYIILGVMAFIGGWATNEQLREPDPVPVVVEDVTPVKAPLCTAYVDASPYRVRDLTVNFKDSLHVLPNGDVCRLEQAEAQ